MKTTLRDLVAMVGCELQGDGALEITGAATLRNAGPGDISIVEGPLYVNAWRVSKATAVVAPPGILPPDATAILAPHCKNVFEKIVHHLRPLPQPRFTGISLAAVVHPTARLGMGVTIHPHAVIGEDVVVGDRTIIHSGCVVMAGSVIGSHSVLYPNVVLYEGTRIGDRVVIHANATLGAYGFGYSVADGRHVLGAQMGHVEIHDDVEIGAGTTIDRGSYDATVIGQGTKIDNQVMVGHNCRIGRHNLLCAQVGVAGSVRTGDYVVLAGQVGIKDHADIGAGAKIGAKAGVHCDVPAGEMWFGTPATPAKDQKQIMIAATRVPEMRRQLRSLERTVRQLQARLGMESLPDADAA